MKPNRSQFSRRFFTTSILGIAMAFVIACCLSSSNAEGENSKRRVVRVALPMSTLQGMDPVDAQLTMDKVFNFVGINEVPFKSSVYKSTEEVYQAVVDEETDLIPMLIEEFLLRPEGCKMDPVLQGVSEEAAGEQLVMLAREDIKIADLKGEKIIIDKAQQMPRIWLDLLLADQGFPNGVTFFGTVKEELRAPDAVLPVFFGEASACITSKAAFETLSELNPQLTQRLKVVAESPPYAMHVICLRSNYEGEQREKIIAGLSSIHESPNGRQLLMLTRISRIDRCDPELVATAGDMLKRWQKLQEPTASEGIKSSPPTKNVERSAEGIKAGGGKL